MSWESEVDRYVRILRTNERSEGYIRNARFYLSALGRSMDPGESFLQLDEDRMLDWFLDVRDHGLTGKGKPIAAASLNSVKGVVKACFRFLNGGETPKSLKGIVVGKNRSRVTKADLPSDEEVSFLANALSPKHKAIVLVIRYSGARPSEVLHLKREDVSPDFDLTFKDTKTGDHRTVVLTKPAAVAALRDWMQQNGDGYLFPSYNKPGEPLGYQAVWLAMTRAAKRLGVKPIVPYALRHARGTELMHSPADLRNDQMGWKSDTTARNYAHTDTRTARAYLEEFEGEEGITQEGFQGLLDQLFSGLKESGFGIELEHEVSQQVEEGEMVSHIFVTGMKAVRRKDHIEEA